MKTVFHPANQRGHANHGWLDAHHSFSFASWYDPLKMHFGALRVLNDDKIAGDMGFGTHPHDNMEIITIPLLGALKHRDSMGNEAMITAGEIQVMSAGTGIQHSEYNATSGDLNLFQIWVFPNKKNVTPRYDQQLLDTAKMKNNFAQILSPDPTDDGVWIHQNAWFHLGEFDKGQEADYSIKTANNGVYVFVVDGQITVNGQQLNKRDALGVWDTTNCSIIFNEKSKVLLLDVPMEFDY